MMALSSDVKQFCELRAGDNDVFEVVPWINSGSIRLAGNKVLYGTLSGGQLGGWLALCRVGCEGMSVAL